MKFIIVFAALFAVAFAESSLELESVRLNTDVHPQSFKFDFATSDGSAHNAEGRLKDVGTEDEALVVTGSYRFVAIDGKTYNISYVARTDYKVQPIRVGNEITDEITEQ